ncbi:MAG: YdeI/OmpD-associated family protein [Terracidiphilus sp.]|jgi:uncharacterized protein YdeI (YjbR/CyaY-like superfamily)
MNASKAKSFTAVLEPAGNRLRWVIARVPFDVTEAWPERKGLRVRGAIASLNGNGGSSIGSGVGKGRGAGKGSDAGFAFRTALFPDPQGEGKVLVVNRKMQAGAKVAAGEKVWIRLEPDLEERPAEVPPELAKALNEDRRLRKWFDGLSYYTRRMMGAIVNEAKSPEAREKRAARMAEWIMLAMEGEKETPPILRAAFLREPLARKGWEAMTPTQRRNHLLGIFHYQSAKSRETRTAEAVEDALRVARKGGA